MTNRQLREVTLWETIDGPLKLSPGKKRLWSGGYCESKNFQARNEVFTTNGDYLFKKDFRRLYPDAKPLEIRTMPPEWVKSWQDSKLSVKEFLKMKRGFYQGEKFGF